MTEIIIPDGAKETDITPMPAIYRTLFYGNGDVQIVENELIKGDSLPDEVPRFYFKLDGYVEMPSPPGHPPGKLEKTIAVPIDAETIEEAYEKFPEVREQAAKDLIAELNEEKRDMVSKARQALIASGGSLNRKIRRNGR